MTTTHGRAERFPGMTVLWKGDIGGELDTIAFDDAEFEARIAALLSHTQPGDHYVRSIANSLTQARRCRKHADADEPELFLCVALAGSGRMHGAAHRP